jgi:hypothetical protein
MTSAFGAWAACADAARHSQAQAAASVRTVTIVSPFIAIIFSVTLETLPLALSDYSIGSGWRSN